MMQTDVHGVQVRQRGRHTHTHRQTEHQYVDGHSEGHSFDRASPPPTSVCTILHNTRWADTHDMHSVGQSGGPGTRNMITRSLISLSLTLASGQVSSQPASQPVLVAKTDGGVRSTHFDQQPKLQTNRVPLTRQPVRHTRPRSHGRPVHSSAIHTSIHSSIHPFINTAGALRSTK